MARAQQEVGLLPLPLKEQFHRFPEWALEFHERMHSMAWRILITGHTQKHYKQ